MSAFGNSNLGKNYIAGVWKEGASQSHIQDLNPYDQSLLATIQCASQSDVDYAYQAAAEAQVKWSILSIGEKQNLFAKLYQVMSDEKQLILDALIAESGSTLLKASIEYDASLSMVRESSSFMTRLYGEIRPSYVPHKENRVYRHPKGVIGVISPWNFPFLLTIRSVVPAVATGNSVVIKPSSDTPITSGTLVAYLFEKAGFMAGLVNTVVGRGSEIGDYFVQHPIPSLISFTGSTEVGRHIGQLATFELKDVALELGGNNAFIVLDDADLDAAAKAAAFGKFLHQGQICMAINKIIVDASVYDEFLSKFTRVVQGIQSGDPKEIETLVGPLINSNQVAGLVKMVEQSVSEGATIHLKGEINGNVFYPTILTNVNQDMTIAKKEIFGPIVSIIKAADEQHAINIANNTPYGLTGSIFTKNLERGVQVGQKIKTGMIHINDQPVNDEAHMPFGGEKLSGVGRFNGDWVMEKFTTVKWISVQHQYRDFPV